jgi:hypothetical protein
MRCAGAYFANIQDALKYYPQWKAAYEFYRKHGGTVNLAGGSSFFVPSAFLQLPQADIYLAWHALIHRTGSDLVCVGPDMLPCSALPVLAHVRYVQGIHACGYVLWQCRPQSCPPGWCSSNANNLP